MPFKKGQIPKGAKPFKKNDPRINKEGLNAGSKHKSTIVKELLEVVDKQVNPLTGEEEDLQYQQAMIAKLMRKVLDDGDVSAFKELMDIAHGKNPDIIEAGITNKDEIDYSKLSDEALDEIIAASKRE